MAEYLVTGLGERNTRTSFLFQFRNEAVLIGECRLNLQPYLPGSSYWLPNIGGFDMQHRILSVGLDPLLLGIRNQLFAKAGYAVYSTRDCSKALAFACLCDIAVLGHTIPFEEREQLAFRLHAAYPKLPIIALYGPTERGSIKSATRSLHGFLPQDLLDALADSLKGKSATAATCGS